jgi:hypothetical protein
VPYPVKKIVFYLLLSASLYGAHRWLITLIEHPAINLVLATVLLAVFAYVVQQKEQIRWAAFKKA